MTLEYSILLLGLAVLALWLPAGRGFSFALALSSFVLGWVSGSMEWSAVLATVAFMLLCFLRSRFKGKAVVFWHLLFLGSAALFLTHSLPGFKSLILLDHHQFSVDSAPYTLSFSWDKAFVGWAYLFSNVRLARSGRDWKEALKSAVLSLIPAIAFTLLIAYLIGYVRLDLKFPAESRLWMFKNLLFVCVAEEAVFRGYLQTELAQLSRRFHLPAWCAVALSALAFGAAHFAGGPSYVLLASIAGFFYGFAYFKSQRIEAAILCHFLLNALHFFVFSYPALLKLVP